MSAPATKIGIEWTRVTKEALQAAYDEVVSALSLQKETNHTLKVAASTTADTAGGNLSVLAGDAAATNANGGDLALDAGLKQGSGVGGTAKLGRTNANAVEIGRTTKATTIKGTLTVDEAATMTGAVTLTGGVTGALAATGDVSAAGGFKCNIGGFDVTLAADQTAAAIKRTNVSGAGWVAPAAGSVMGASGSLSAAITGSSKTLKVRVYKNGSLLNAALDLDFTTGGAETSDYAAVAKDLYTFAAGDVLKLVYTTTTITNTPTFTGDIVVEF